MTWSIAHEQQYNQTPSMTAESLAPWEYFFETWLPSKGWTVTDDEDGGMLAADYNLGSMASAKWYGLTKTITDALGVSRDRSYIVAINFIYRYVTYYTWDGTPGGGYDVNSRYHQSSIYSVGTSYYWRFLESDQDSSSWMVLLGTSSVGGFEFPASQIFLATPGIDVYPSLTSHETSYGWSFTDKPMIGRIGGDSFANTCYLLTPNFGWGRASDGTTVALNSTNDLLMKFNGTTSSQVTMDASAPASFEINGTYYLDLKPSSTRSFVLETGSTDMGLF